MLTRNTALASAPGNTLVPRGRTGLRRASAVNASQIATVDKAKLEDLIGAVDEGIRWFLGLG